MFNPIFYIINNYIKIMNNIKLGIDNIEYYAKILLKVQLMD